MLKWRDVEPAQGQYNWQLVDAAINDSAATGKPVFLRVIAGIFSPAWVGSVAKMVTLPATSSTPSGIMPAPWDRGFLTVWEAFVNAYGQRYNGNSHVALIETAGTGIYGESYLPGGPALWNAAGYTESGYVAAVEEIINTYARAFPRTLLGFDTSVGVVGSGQNVIPILVQWAVKNYPTRVYVQMNGLSASLPVGHWPVDNAPLYGMQMLSGTPTAATGTLCGALRVGLLDRAAYVEVYYADVVNPANAAALKYLRNRNPSASC